VRNPPPDASESLREALERNLDWIKTYIRAPEGRARDIGPYIDWIYARLKEQIPALAAPEELDRLIRNEVRNLFEREAPNGARKAFFGDVGELEDPSALGFERRLELSDEVRACLECLPEETRELVIEAFTLTEADLSGKDARDRLASRLGINRNTLDQRISRAIRRIRERMRGRPESNRH
jgi:DNA-directed RNA polymerase specialized sigma24 family protein